MVWQTLSGKNKGVRGMKKLVTLILAGAFLVNLGCTKKIIVDWQAAGGSRADATVEVGYSYNPVDQVPQANEAQAHEQALKRCRAWGYSEAEAFGLVTRRCVNTIYTMFGPMCNEMLVTKQFQCLGRGDSRLPNEPANIK